MNIKVPQTLKDCTPDMLAKWVFSSGGKLDLETLSEKLDFRVQTVSIFSGISRERLENYSPIDINTIFEHLINILASYKGGDPKGLVSIGEVNYVFDMDFSHMTAGQIIDIKLIEDVYSEPLQVLATLYIEDGYKYNDVKDGNIILNPIEKRMEAFKEFPGDEFLSVFSFFLSSYEKRSNAIYALTMARTKIQMETMKSELKQEMLEIQNGLNGRKT